MRSHIEFCFIVCLISQVLSRPDDSDCTNCINCTSPKPVEEGCVECYSYEVAIVKKNTVMMTTKCVPVLEDTWAKDCLMVLGITEPTPEIIASVLQQREYWSVYVCPHIKTEMCINTTVVKMSAIPVCKVTKLVYRDCWCGTVLCLNIPQPTINERIVCFANFKSLLGQNSLFVYPIISELEEDDDFVMDTSSGRTCNIFELADRRFRTENLDISFLRQNTSSNKRGVSILLAKKNEEMPSPAKTVASSKIMTISNCTKEKLTDRVGSSSSGTTPVACCCKELPIPIEQLCSAESLEANPYYQRYLSLTIPYNGTCGFDGYKGCLGAEFFRCDGFVESLTEEECRTFTLGMTPAEADQFLTDGASLWNILTVEPTRTHPFCQDSVSVSSEVDRSDKV
jgi:hypothetical protein